MKQENLMPALSGGAWTTFTPRENKCPAFFADGEEALGIRAAAFSDCGKWLCTVPVTAGQHYDFSVDVRTARVVSLRASVQVILSWFSADGGFLRCDYAAEAEPLPDGAVRLSRRLCAPQGKPYAADAASLRVELLFWNSDDGEAVFRAPRLVPAAPRPHRRARVVTTYISPYAADSLTPEGRLEKILRTADRAGALSPDIICFSEGIATRELRVPLEEHAQTVPGPLTERLGAVCRKYHTYLVFNLHEQENGFFYNTAVLLDREGRVAGKYRKVHLTLRECDKGITPGRDYPVFETDFGRIGIVICFDHFYPESVRQLVMQGAELVFIPTAGDGYMQSTARATDNGIPVCIACVNHAAASPWPQSRIVSPTGTILAGTMDDEGVACATIDFDDPPLNYWFSVGPAYAVKRDICRSEARPDTYQL